MAASDHRGTQIAPDSYREVLGVLLSFAVKRRRVFPSLNTIARMAMVSKATVLRAIAWLSLFGFLDRLRRIVRTTGLLGPRVRQTSTAYVLRFPRGLGELAVNVFDLDPGCHNCTPSESNSAVKWGLRGKGVDFAPPAVEKRPVSEVSKVTGGDWREKARRMSRPAG
jgi:hypothetical protein